MTTVSPRRTTVFVVLTLALVALVIAAGAAIAVTLRAYRYYHAHQTNYVGDSFIMDDPVVGYVQRPGIHNRYTAPPAYDIYTDDLGARVDKQGMQAPRKVDLLAVGDSFTWGHGVQDESTYVRRLARAKHLTASNVALASYGLTTSYLSFRKFSFLEPTIVIFGFIEDDVNRAFQPCAPSLSPYCRAVPFVDFDSQGDPFIHPPEYRSREYYEYMQDVILDHSFGWKDVLWELKRDRLILSGKDGNGINQQHGRFINDPASRQRGVQFLLDSLVKDVRDRRATLIVVYIPVMTTVTPLPPEVASVAPTWVDNQHVFLVDTTSVFDTFIRDNGSDVLKAGGVDGHPSEVAHQMIADQIAPVIDKILARPDDIRKSIAP